MQLTDLVSHKSLLHVTIYFLCYCFNYNECLHFVLSWNPLCSSLLQPVAPCVSLTESVQVYKEHCRMAKEFHQVKHEIAALEDRKWVPVNNGNKRRGAAGALECRRKEDGLMFLSASTWDKLSRNATVLHWTLQCKISSSHLAVSGMTIKYNIVSFTNIEIVTS